jgi:hypothetical protein
MARPLPSSPRPYYPEPIDEDGLEALVAIIRPRLIDPDSEPRVRDLLRDQLEDSAGRLKNEVRASSPAQDVAKLWEIYDEIQRDADAAVDLIRSLWLENPALRHRLRWAFGPGPLANPEVLRERDVEVIPKLVREIERENARGRPSKDALKVFSYRILRIWRHFTAAGTAGNRTFGLMRPFERFLQAAGELLVPRFKSPYYARYAHERWMSEQSEPH